MMRFLSHTPIPPTYIPTLLRTDLPRADRLSHLSAGLRAYFLSELAGPFPVRAAIRVTIHGDALDAAGADVGDPSVFVPGQMGLMDRPLALTWRPLGRAVDAGAGAEAGASSADVAAAAGAGARASRKSLAEKERALPLSQLKSVAAFQAPAAVDVDADPAAAPASSGINLVFGGSLPAGAGARNSVGSSVTVVVSVVFADARDCWRWEHGLPLLQASA